MTPEEKRKQTQDIRARQKSRNIVLGLVLLGMAVLFFALTVARFPTSP